MAMLAESRKKQKWMLNPRGKDWSNDTNKFGQRMLEKMGWTTGKGLGINEQGATDHIRIKLKNDTVGIGFKNEQDKAWTEHQKAFDSFLSSLNENADSDAIKTINLENSGTNTQSLELKSKQSRARVHYQKFTRGKDVKKYSAKDLADILGSRDILNKENQIEEPQEKDTNIAHNIENIPESTVTINKGSITDYFKKKTSQFLKDKDNSNINSMNGSDDEIEQYRGFGFLSKSPNKKKINKPKLECNYTFDNPALDLHNSNDAIVQENTNCSNKRKGDTSIEYDMHNLDHEQNFAKKIKIGNDNNCKEGFINMALDLDTNINENHVTNKFEVSRINLGLTNDALDLTDEIREKKRVTFNNHVEYSTDSSKKKKHTGTLDKFEVDTTKKRKKKHKQFINTDVSNKIGIVNEALDINLMSEELKDNKVNESKSKKNKKLKQQRRSNLETIEETSEEAGINNDREVENLDNNVNANQINEEYGFEEKYTEIKKKKKKCKNKKHEAVAEDTINHVSENINYSRKKEKVKKKDKHIIMSDNITCEKVVEKTNREKNSKETHKNEEDVLNVALNKDEEHLVIKESVVEDEVQKKLKYQRKNDKKYINKDLESELEQNIDDPKINEEVRIKAESKHDINDKKVDVLDDTKEDNGTINVSNSEMQLKDMECPKIKRERNMKSKNFFIKNSEKSKRIIRSFYNVNDIVNFPGSNLNKIRDYGANV